MVIASRPDHAFQIAFNADPNDPAAVRVWTDLTGQLLGASGAKRGKQLELDLGQAAQPTIDLIDPNEYLNPGNPSSPYAPNVLPLREVLWQCVWPNTTVGNLLNAGSQGQAYDCSFESYTAGTSVAWIAAVGAVTPTVQAANPHGGANSLQYAVASGATVQGVAVTLPCIPGRQYTASWWVRQSSASTQQIAVTGIATGTSTAATATYTRLTVTFTATQPTHVLTLQTTGTAVAGTVNLDDLQYEQGAAATANTTTGPAIYGVMRDYIEEWPAEWDQDSQGYFGLCSTTATDAFAVLAGVDLWGEYRNSVLAKAPDYYWPLNEPNGAVSFAEASGNSGPQLVTAYGPSGAPSTFAPGTAHTIVGDAGGTGLLIDSNDGKTTSGAYLRAGATKGGKPLSVGTPTPNWSVTVSFWHASPADAYTIPIGDGGSCLMLWGGPNTLANVNALIYLTIGPITKNVDFRTSFNGLSFAQTMEDSITLAAGAGTTPHHFVAQVVLGGGNITHLLWRDGVQLVNRTQTLVFEFGTATPDLSAQSLHFCGWATDDSSSTSFLWGNYSHLAIWNRALSGAEVADLYTAGSTGYSGETSGARIARYLSYGWSGQSNIDTGQSVMGISNTPAAGTPLLTACQSVTTSENGNLFVDAKGAITFQSRTRRYLQTTASYVFGENTGAGEIPYLGDVKFNFDRLQIYNTVTVNNAGGAGATVSDAASRKRYFPNGYQRQVNVSDLEAADAANWILTTHKQPVQRVEHITLDPGSNPALWPVVLSLELGTRVTLKKRSKAANGGAGLTQSADFFIESIEHGNIDFEAGTWTTTLLLSPAAAVQPWLLGDATYGVLDTTTVLGY